LKEVTQGIENQGFNGTNIIDAATLKAGAALDKAIFEKQRTQKAIDDFDFSLTLAKERDAALLAQLAQSETTLNQRKQECKICAPSSGTVRLKIGPGSFVAAGGILAEIEV